MTTSLLQSVWTVLAFVSFVGVVVWAWSKRRGSEFDAAAHIPLNDDRPLDVDVHCGASNPRTHATQTED